MRPHRGTLILVLGILGLTLCSIFTAIPAWVMGSGDLKAMAAGQMDPSGEGITKVGKILGMISVGLHFVGLVVFVLIAVGAVAVGIHSQQ